MFSDLMRNIHLSPREILEFCIQFEVTSSNLYNNISKVARTPEMKELFTLISGEELIHRDTFHKILYEGKTEIYQQKTLPEHNEFLHGLVNSTIFSKEMLKQKMKNIRNIESSFEFLISLELDQILLYGEIKDFLLDEHKHLIDDIITEERKHFVRLMQLKQMQSS